MLLFVSGLIAGASFIVAELGRNADPFMPHLHAAPAGKEPDRGADHGRSRRPEGCRREARHSTEHSGGRRAWSRSRRGIRRRVRRFDASNPQCDPGRRRMERDGPGNARAWSWLRLFGHGPSIELNPVRARMVRHPRDDRWWSCRAHAQGVDGRLLANHDLYHLAAARPHGRRHTAPFYAPRSRRGSSTACALRPKAAGLWVMPASSDGSPRRSAVAPWPRGRPLKEKPDQRQLNLR